jgi:formylglycine-generating enzyme required for sulfatase activity
MHGNSVEWCYDWYEADYLALPTNVDPKGPLTGTYRVCRGGGYGVTHQYTRSAYRNKINPDNSENACMGFRVVFVL